MAVVAALKPLAGRPASPSKKLFAEILQQHPRPTPVVAHEINRSFNSVQQSIVKEAASFKGKPAVFFTEEDIQALWRPFKSALVGKFSKGRPNMESLRKEFVAVGFKGEFFIGLLDFRHILIRFDCEEDYLRC